jgi:hypothetical protein
MEDLLFDGAFGESGSFDADTIPIGTETRAFTLTVSEDDKEPRIITVNLNITLDPDTETSIYHREGAGTSEDPYYYVKVRDAELPNTDIVNASFTAFESGEVKDLQNAFVWVDRYGEGGASNTGFANGTTEGYSEYRLFLKKSQKIGKMGLQFTNSDSDTRDHMSVELYGAGQPGSKELKITRDDGYSTDIQLQMLNYISSIEGFISLRGIKYATLVLGKNITIDAEGISTDINTQFLSAGGGTWRSMLVSYLIYVEQQKEMIIMHDYSKLTGCYVPISSHLYCPIYLGWPSTSIAATMSKLHLYGGAITGNIVGGIIIHGKPLENSYPAVVLHKDKAIDTIIFDNTNIEGVVVNRINRN